MIPPPGTHVRYDLASNRAQPWRGVGLEIWRWLCILVLLIGRFHTAGDWPALAKAVIIAAPHTSNWDGIWMIAAAGKYRVTLRWMGKKSIADGPFGWLAKAAGIVAIDRSQSKDVVSLMAEAFAAAPTIMLAVAPEGTRDPVETWKTGFWHIARVAHVPLLFAVMDYGTRTVRISGHLWPSDEYDADLAVIRTHYAGATGRHVERFQQG